MEQLTTGQIQFVARFPDLADRVIVHGSANEALQLFWAYELAMAGLANARTGEDQRRVDEYGTLLASIEAKLQDILTPVAAWSGAEKASA